MTGPPADGTIAQAARTSGVISAVRSVSVSDAAQPGRLAYAAMQAPHTPQTGIAPPIV